MNSGGLKKVSVIGRVSFISNHHVYGFITQGRKRLMCHIMIEKSVRFVNSIIHDQPFLMPLEQGRETGIIQMIV